MFCNHCNAKIVGKPVKQGNEFYCSLECANQASGVEPEDTEGYFEEQALDEFYGEEE